ncbi:outer membrane beta-barrel protein [Flavobacterium sp.]|uniref:outer membrane beta-barrel protein n=1 Tax=Flavobacterium sp. TaxID=239 RepID=UPI00286E86A9|nr:outer membrane beta-barrel protein [Flavobacterium sp.]
MKNLASNYHRIIVAVFITLFLLIASNNTQAQNKWELTFRPGLSFPTKDYGPTKLGIGWGFEATISYRFMPHLFAYTGWGWNSFSEKNAEGINKLSFDETGYSFGFQFIHPIPNYKLKYLISLGGIYNHIEIENNNGDILADSGHGLGWEVATGVSYPFGDRFHITPSIRYRSLSRDLKIGSITTQVDLNYFSVNGAISWSF